MLPAQVQRFRSFPLICPRLFIMACFSNFLAILISVMGFACLFHFDEGQSVTEILKMDVRSRAFTESQAPKAEQLSRWQVLPSGCESCSDSHKDDVHNEDIKLNCWQWEPHQTCFQGHPYAHEEPNDQCTICGSP